MGAEQLLDEARREAATWRQQAAANRREADRFATRLKRVEAELEQARRRISGLLSGNHELHSDLTFIVTSAEGGGSTAPIARRARRALSRLPREGL